MKYTLLLVLFSCLVLSGQSNTSGGRSSADQRYQMFQDYLLRRTADVTRSFPGNVKSLDDWKRGRPALRQQALYMLGLDPMPARTPLNTRVTGQFERDGYRVENVVFESMPGLYVTGNLYIPKDHSGPMSTVLYLCGHSPGPWGAKVHYQHHGIWLAQHGYVAFLIDTIEFGEVPGIHHGTHDLEMWDWLSLGYTPAGSEAWNAIRAMDYLETRPEVDPKKVAVTGISGGGAITWYAAAVDERFQVAAPVCATWTAEHSAALDLVHENCDCIYFYATFLRDLPAVGALIAPRPLKILNARKDSMFPPEGYHDVFQRVRQIYELYGAADKIEEFDYEAPHRDILPFRKEAYEWTNRWLKNDPTPYSEGEVEREEAATLTVLDRDPSDAVNGYIHKTFVPVHKPGLPTTLEQWKTRRAELLAEIKDKSLRGFPSSKVPFVVWKRENKGWTSNYSDAYDVEFNTEEGIRVTGQLFVPRDGKPSHPALIYVKGGPDIVYPVDYDYLLPALGSHIVLVLQPRAVDYPMNNYKAATVKRTAALFGATIESMQVWDVQRAIDYLKDEERLSLSSISLYARKDMGVPILYAAALDDRVSRVILDNPPYSHWQGPAILNALRYTDLPEVAAMLAPRELVSLTPLPGDYELTSRIYALYGKTEQVREAYALGDALQVWKHQ